ncbi:hypothetical protein C8J57DRAFT_1504830 [Mycena rebaudengoi]|nr:hypothetical protein C8J57DRAFT_1504830 [Mycena rebaudengoi]
MPSLTLTTNNHDYRHCFSLFTVVFHFCLHHHIIIRLLFYSFYRHLPYSPTNVFPDNYPLPSTSSTDISTFFELSDEENEDSHHEGLFLPIPGPSTCRLARPFPEKTMRTALCIPDPILISTSVPATDIHMAPCPTARALTLTPGMPQSTLHARAALLLALLRALHRVRCMLQLDILPPLDPFSAPAMEDDAHPQHPNPNEEVPLVRLFPRFAQCAATRFQQLSQFYLLAPSFIRRGGLHSASSPSTFVLHRVCSPEALHSSQIFEARLFLKLPLCLVALHYSFPPSIVWTNCDFVPEDVFYRTVDTGAFSGIAAVRISSSSSGHPSSSVFVRCFQDFHVCGISLELCFDTSLVIECVPQGPEVPCPLPISAVSLCVSSSWVSPHPRLPARSFSYASFFVRLLGQFLVSFPRHSTSSSHLSVCNVERMICIFLVSKA